MMKKPEIGPPPLWPDKHDFMTTLINSAAALFIRPLKRDEWLEAVTIWLQTWQKFQEMQKAEKASQELYEQWMKIRDQMDVQIED